MDAYDFRCETFEAWAYFSAHSYFSLDGHLEAWWVFSDVLMGWGN